MNSELKKRRILPWVLSAFVLFCLAFAAGHELSRLLFKFTGRPSELPAHVISGLIGIALFFSCSFIFKHISEWYERTHPREEKRRQRFGHHEILLETLDAIERIAQGDFTVLVPIARHDPYSELAESVNKMAKELGTMEAARQEFISNVSHEIQSPLTSIGGFAALLRNDTLPKDQREHYLNIIEAESKRLSALSDNLLKLSALESGSTPMVLKAYRLDKQLESTALMLEPQWNGKDLQFEAALTRVTITGDEGLLSQVWINLLHNAIKFTSSGGSIRIELSETAEETVLDGSKCPAPDEKEIICRISDTGSGIAPEDLIHIFERFYKADKSRDRSLGGNGLGLSLVKKIVELHDGTIDVQSALGVGTTFTVRLPAVPFRPTS
ncbi:MAG: HAMP domain-containing histidine kinase [Clostridiales Family XIII bacterium]|nr:HAMP domain-containing histidine kinase [Clostridiales Family XIII bacterium]